MSRLSFDVEKAIRAWRRSYEYRRAFTQEDLKELECHLRDQIDSLRAEGLPERDAFEQAVRDAGDYAATEDEYGKVFWEKAQAQGRLGHELIWRTEMIKSYLTTTLRHFARHKSHTSINVFGLALGLACCLLILLYVRAEVSYDRFHEKADRIYRVLRQPEAPTQDGATGPSPLLPLGVGPALPSYFSEIEQAVRLRKGQRVLLSYRHQATGQNVQAYENGLIFADSTIFEVFSFPLIAGDPATALAAPYQLVMTQTTARKYFGDGNPIGQVINVDNEYDFTVTGIVRDPPQASSLSFDMLASFNTLSTFGNFGFLFKYAWRVSQFPTYVLLTPEAEPASVANRFHDFIRASTDEEALLASSFRLESLTDEHLFSDAAGSITPSGDLRYLYIFSTIGFVILLIAVINYMNLATARSLRRAREIGVRKVVGAQREQLSFQFLSESVLTCLAAFPLALMLVQIVAPGVSPLIQHDLTLDYGRDGLLLIIAFAFVLVLGLLAGSYPALLLSNFRAIDVLKGSGLNPSKGKTLRRGLVVTQFMIATVLVIGTLGMQRQLSFIQSKELGLEPTQVVAIPLEGAAQQQPGAFKTAVLAESAVAQAALTSTLPAESAFQQPVAFRGQDVMMAIFWVDADFMATMDVDIAAGRAFDPARDEPEQQVLLNEQAARALQQTSTELLGQTVSWFDSPHEVVGIVRDFHFESLHEPIKPALFFLNDGALYLTVQLKTSDVSGALATLETVWDRFAPEYPFVYHFLDDRYAALYENEQRLQQLSRGFMGISLFIACLGLYGLAAFMAEQRTKEIGVRKVLGASVPGLVALFSQEFLRLVLAAVMLAAPLGYLVLRRWLEDFAYRVDLTWTLFALSGLAVLLIAFLTISYQVIKAAHANPVNTLRYE